jgi:hypothetical protein
MQQQTIILAPSTMLSLRELVSAQCVGEGLIASSARSDPALCIAQGSVLNGSVLDCRCVNPSEVLDFPGACRKTLVQNSYVGN